MRLATYNVVTIAEISKSVNMTLKMEGIIKTKPDLCVAGSGVQHYSSCAAVTLIQCLSFWHMI